MAPVKVDKEGVGGRVVDADGAYDGIGDVLRERHSWNSVIQMDELVPAPGHMDV